MASRSERYNPLWNPILFVYQLIQWLINKALSPYPPTSESQLRRPKVAIIGAGITGVTAAAHCVGHGFDVTIFEAGPEEQIGGIWSVSNPVASTQTTKVYLASSTDFLLIVPRRESTIPPPCKSTPSCTASTPP